MMMMMMITTVSIEMKMKMNENEKNKRRRRKMINKKKTENTHKQTQENKPVVGRLIHKHRKMLMIITIMLWI